MNPEPQVAESKFARDMKSFDQLSTKTKELVVLKDAAEKTTGPENVRLHKKIRTAAARGNRAPGKLPNNEAEQNHRTGWRWEKLADIVLRWSGTTAGAPRPR